MEKDAKLEALSLKTMQELTDTERTYIRDSYLRFFDTCKPRRRAIGYCVVLGGIPSSAVGLVDVNFSRLGETVCYSLSMGPVPLFDSTPALKAVLESYILSDKVLHRYAAGAFTDDRVSVPLFRPTMNSENERVHDCKTLMYAAGKAMGFNAKTIRLSELGSSLFIPTQINMKDGDAQNLNTTRPGEFYARIVRGLKRTCAEA